MTVSIHTFFYTVVLLILIAYLFTAAISVNFSQSLYATIENSTTVQPMLLLTNPSSTNIRVEVVSTNDTALGKHTCTYASIIIVFHAICLGRGIDYDSRLISLEIPAGTTSLNFSVEIVDDNVLEDFETFNLTINSFSLPANVSVTTPNRTVVLIIDNDGEFV